MANSIYSISSGESDFETPYVNSWACDVDSEVVGSSTGATNGFSQSNNITSYSSTSERRDDNLGGEMNMEIESLEKKTYSDIFGVGDIGQPNETGGKRKNAGSPKRKGKEKANTELEKQTKKQKLAEEKAAKKTARDLNKIYKPGECMKYMNLEGHPSLWARWYMSDVPREAAAVGAHVVHASTLCDPAVVVWTRSVPRTLETDSGQIKLSPTQEPCDRALYVASADEICELVSSHTLSSHLTQIQQLCDCRLTLLVFVHDYFKSPRRTKSNSNRAPMTEIDFELAQTDLLVSAKCDTVIVNTPNELALTIVQFTKAIAEAPFKEAIRVCDERADFYMRGANKKSVAVDNDGAGTANLWQQMLATLPQSSLETSRALCARYKSPQALYEVLQTDNIMAVADIGVSRAGVGGSKARRVGPEFARRLHKLFTSTHGDLLID